MCLATRGNISATAQSWSFLLTSPKAGDTSSSVKPAPDPGSLIRLNVKLTSSGAADSRELIANVELIGGQDVLGPPADVNMSGQATGDIVTWVLPPLAPGEAIDLGFSVLVIPEVNTATDLKWNLTLAQNGNVIINTEAKGTVGEVSTSPTNISEATLAKLITFLVGLSVVALVFGAWANLRNPKSNREYLRLFVEGIAVVMLIGAILILVMGGGLKAESGASLLGVIAGYIFGRAASGSGN
jgi:hypothetical protein